MENNQETAQMPDELSPEEIQEYSNKAKEILNNWNSLNEAKPYEIYPVVLIEPENNERIVAFIKEPNYLLKLKIMDKSFTQGLYSAADELRELCILKDKSDPRTYSDEPQNDKYKLGVTDFCITLVKRSSNQYKKK